MSDTLDRRIGLVGAVAVGVSSMVGAGLFVVFAPAVEAAGSGLLLALTIAAGVAACNAISSARLARLHPVSGGTYVYGRERLGPFWGYLAGWSFVAGKIASCAAMSLAIGAYAWPEHSRVVAIAVIAALTAINLAGVEKSAVAGIAISTVVLTVVVVVVATTWTAPAVPTVDTTPSVRGVLEAAGLLFFAFAGYARLSTLGEEVRDPRRTIPRAIAIAVVVVIAVYAVSALALLHALGARELAGSARPFVAGLDAAGAGRLVPLVVVASALAAGGALLSLLLGVSRTMFAMARDAHLPRPVARVGARRRVPYVAEVVAAVIVSGLVLLGDLSSSIAFSSFCVLIYYAIANVSALTLDARWPVHLTAVLGVAGCAVLAAFLPLTTVLSGSAVVGVGAAIYSLRRRGPARPASQST